MAPPATCPACKRPLPKEKTAEDDAPARGKKWTRLTIVMPEQSDKDAIEEKLEVMASRYEEVTGRKVARFMLLDWILHEMISSGILPAEEGG
jgi:hypothetical protein